MIDAGKRVALSRVGFKALLEKVRQNHMALLEKVRQNKIVKKL